MKLIIVESPTKAKTISKFISKEYQVDSSFGHIRDLPVKELGIDLENNFTPKYIIPTKAKKTVNNLKALAKKADLIILASDADREGEAIAWHLTQALNIKEEKTQRIIFHEISKEAIEEALQNPQQLNFNLVEAQQARRILDRLLGYKLSPFLWKKVARGLSAGRVQSVATRLIVEREEKIKNFTSEEYWTLTAVLNNKKKESLEADLFKVNNKNLTKLEIKKDYALDLKLKLTKASYLVKSIEEKESSKTANPPFTTSTLQQAANRYFGFSAKQTMVLAQRLYENGHITYMRTDSVNLSNKFKVEAKNWIIKNLGKDYFTSSKSFKNRSKNVQEAHEAIRPTKLHYLEELSKKLETKEFKLYQLIWQRAVASQIVEAKINTQTILIEASNKNNIYHLKASGQLIKFDGYLSIWPEQFQEKTLIKLKEKEELNLVKVKEEKHETRPPARYSDAGLVKEMEKYGIGRPSTYAPTISTIITRNYVERDESRRLKPTEIAFIVNDLLIKHFPQVVDYKFTANMEENLDLIARGSKNWLPVISNFYQDFAKNLETKYQELTKEDIMPIEESKEICDKCGSKMIIKTGRYGKFLACSAFPECKNIKGLQKNTGDKIKPDPKIIELGKKYQDLKCDKCESKMVIKSGRYGPFLACSAYPKCKNIKNISENNAPVVSCPICNTGKIVKKISRRGVFYACNNYPNCKNIYSGEPSGKNCPNCNALMIYNKSNQEICSNKDCK